MEIKYSESRKIATVDGLNFCRDERTGYYLSSKPIGKRRKRLHVYIWEKHNGAIPYGHEVHHLKGKDHNELSDLLLMSREEHQRFHAENLSDERRAKMRKNLIEKAVPKAAEWHRSKEGREWHRKHGKDVWKNKLPKTYTCTNCGKEFETLNCYSAASNRFCSNNCKSAYRRKLGVDNETRNCQICGKKFTANKYSTKKRCSDCRHIRNKKGRE